MMENAEAFLIDTCVGAGKSTLMSISDGLRPYIFCRKIEKTRSTREEMDGKVFSSRQSWHFLFIYNIIRVLFPVCTLIWRMFPAKKKI